MAATLFDSVTDRAVGNLAAQLTAGVTSLTLNGGEGALFPDPDGADNPFNFTIENERLRCTARTGDVLTVTRAQEGTSDVTHAGGVSVELRMSSIFLTSLQDAINAIEDGSKTLDSVTATGIVTSTSGGLVSGVEGVTSGLLTLWGGLTGNEGGELRLHMTEDNDTDNDYWAIDVSTDDMRFFQSGGEQVMVLVGHATAPWLRVVDRLEIDGDLDHDGSNVGFFAVAPVARASAYTQTFATADKTHANPTGLVLTDSSGGTASQTLAAITGGGGSCENATKDAVASLADEVNKIIADVADVKELSNAIIDDLQAYGLFQ